MSELETGTAPAASPAEAIADAPVTEATETEQRVFDGGDDAELKAIWDKHHVPRAEDGKFAPRNPVEPAKDGEAAPEAVEGQAPEGEAKEPGSPAIQPPHSWSAERKAEWATFSPEAQEYILKRENDSHSQISRLGQQVKALEPVASVLEQHKAVFERNGLDYQQGITALLNAQVQLEQNPVAAIQSLARAYGVDLGGFSGQQDGNSTPPQVAMLQSQIAALQRQLQETSSRVLTREQREAEQQQQAIEAQVNDFLKDKEDFATLESEIVALIPAVKLLSPGKSPAELLAEAYEMAQNRNPVTRAKKLDAERKAQEAKASEEAKRKADEAKRIGRTNVRATTPTTSKPKSSDDALKEIAMRHYGTL